MHIINLTVECKTATGDGTKIVCMNGDYKVRVTAEDCGTFTNAPVKKLIVKYQGMEYFETPIEQVTDGGKVVLQASLPHIPRSDWVELGVCGKESESTTPVYVSTGARFECDKSVLNGAVVLKTDPVLSEITVAENGTYLATDNNADGFYKVNVIVAQKTEETRTVDLEMYASNQIITPTSSNRTLKEVIVRKPAGLVPENIKSGITIGGVTGSYEQKLMEKTIHTDGEYYPDKGFDGFSSVVVSAGRSRLDRVLNLATPGLTAFSHAYTAPKVNVTLSKNGVVTWTNDGAYVQVTAQAVGDCEVKIEECATSGKVTNTFYYDVYVIDNDKSPIGTLHIKTSGTYLVSPYMYAEVNVPEPMARIENGVLYITKG